MIPTKTITDQMAALLAADATTIAPAMNGVNVHLIVSPFVPGPATDFTALTEATFTGATALAAGTGTQQNFVDPVTGNNVVQLLEPAGGWHWQCTVAPMAPQTVYGYAVTNHGNTGTYGSNLLPTPVVIQNVGDAVDIPEVRYAIPQGVIT